MARKLIRVKILGFLIIATTVYSFHSGFFSSSYDRIFDSSRTTDPFTNVTAEGNWFPMYDQRLQYGDSNVFRNPDVPYYSRNEMIDEIGSRTYLMVKTGVDVMWERMPIHFSTTFKRFPYHQTYAEANAQIGSETIIDAIEMLPNSVKFSGELPEYEGRSDAMDGSFGWDLSAVKVDGGHGWWEDRFKNIPMLYHSWLNAPKSTEWFIMVDDDTYLMSKSIGAILRHYDPNGLYYIGSKAVCFDYLAQNGKYAEKMRFEDPTRKLTQPFAHGGSGIVMSRGLVDALFHDPAENVDLVNRYSEICMQTSFGDAILGYLFREELGVDCNDNTVMEMASPDPFLGETLTSTNIPTGNFCQALASFHHVKPAEIRTLFEWERSLVDRKPNSGHGVLYADFYHDFILPYLIPYRENWDNYAKEVQFHDDQMFSENDPDMVPGESPANCSYTCDVYVHCVMWKWERIGTSTRCGVSMSSYGRGISTDKKNGKDSPDESICGWRLDRIRQLRSASECDPVKRNPISKIFNDDDSTSEGWYYRSLEDELKTKKRDDWVYNWTLQKLV